MLLTWESAGSGVGRGAFTVLRCWRGAPGEAPPARRAGAPATASQAAREACGLRPVLAYKSAQGLVGAVLLHLEVLLRAVGGRKVWVQGWEFLARFVRGCWMGLARYSDKF